MPTVAGKLAGLLARLDREGRAAPIPLSQALADPSEQVRLAAAKALGQIDSQSEQVLAALERAARDGDKPLRLASLDSLRRQGVAAVPVLREQLRDDDLAIRQQSVKTLTSLGPAAAGALPELTELLKSDNRLLQLAAIRCLGSIGREAESAVAPLHELLKPDENASPQKYWESAVLRREAAIALIRLGPRASVAIPTLIDILQSPVEGEKHYLFDRQLVPLGSRPDGSDPSFRPARRIHRYS